MDYFLFIWSVSTYVEKRMKEDISYDELEKEIGFSYRHIREVFKDCTKVSLARYIVSRRISNAAFEIVHTNRDLIHIAGEYGFDGYDAFTRAFKRETGVTPSEFRKGKFLVGRARLVAGAYAPFILKENNQLLQSLKTEVDVCMKNVVKTSDSCILYGVPKVEYTYEECTPFPSCLKACLNYMGQKIDYAYLMAASGAAFRLRWNTKCWDGGNVDIQCIYENRLEAFIRSFKAAGRSYKLLERENSDKEAFKAFIKAEIDEGRPVIALGIIGPPEACIVTGYTDSGNTLLGWNFFQTNPEFAGDSSIHETGYFICNNWWENKNTCMLMSIGEEIVSSTSLKDLLSNAIQVLSKEQILHKVAYTNETQEYAGGKAAYTTWAKAIGNDSEFPENAILPLLFERIMCQNDAQVMVGEGRSYAACFMEWIGNTNAQVSEYCTQAAKHFRLAAECAFKMNEPKGGFEQNEATTRKFAKSSVRRQIVPLILEAGQNDEKACELIVKIVEML